MAKIKKGEMRWLFIVTTFMAIVLFVVSILSKNNMPNFQQSLRDKMISKDEALTKVKTLPEVIDYLKRVPNGLVFINGDEDNAYMIQVYEIKNGHTATFNWYKVNKTTGKVEKQF